MIGRLTTGIGGVARGIGKVIANPIPALIAAAVAAIAFAVYEIVTHWEEIKAWFTAFKEALVEMFGAIGEWFSEKFTAAKDAVKNAWTGMVEFFVGIKDGIVQAWENLKQGIHDRLEAIRTACVEIPQNIKNSVTQKFEEIKEAIRTKVEEAKNAVTNTFNNIKSNIKNVIDAIRDSVRGTFENIKAFITNPIQYTKDRVAYLFDGIKNTIKDKIEYARDIVQNAVERIKGFFNFSWSLPDLKLPHIVVGSYINVPVLGTIPDPTSLHVEWYKKAYDNAVAFTSPTVLPTLSGMKGFGDGRGAEIVMGEDLFRKYAGDTINVAINVTAQPGQNVNELANIIESKMIQKVRREQRVFG
ncbi:MAG: apolipoprotein A1/A4/E family protein [Kiritimatiellae bacterium]|nr:apolipoprotein A1/A4/E family protein [Kiritimatiellia bacterium]